MKFESDDGKNRANLRKHGLDFEDADQLFNSLFLVDADTREDYGEQRWTGIGLIDGRVAHVVFTQPEFGTIRIISLRKATRRERKQYEEAIQNRLEAG